MDYRGSEIWKETLKREKRVKAKWESKYLSPEELKQQEGDAMNTLAMGNGDVTRQRMSEKEASERRLSNLGRNIRAQSAPPGRTTPEVALPPPIPAYQIARQQLAEKVSEMRPRSHRLTQDKRLAALLGDIGPGLWVSMNPAYVHASKSTRTTSSHYAHGYDDSWKISQHEFGKKYHMRNSTFVSHAEKCLQLGEKPFKSGGMKLTGGS